MFLCLNYCFICVEMTRLGELLHSMLFVGRWHLLYSIANALNDIDPDLNYLSTDIRSLNTQYFDDQTFREKFKFNNTLSMCHLNIRSLLDHFIEFTAYIEHLNIDFKIIALSETWLKLHHINYIIPSYNIVNELRIKKRGGGVSLYIHNSLQYKVRHDLKIGNDQETINSVFIQPTLSVILLLVVFIDLHG